MADQNNDLQLQQLKNIILKDDNQRVVNTVKQHAREIVSNVITESIHDREKKDHSISTVLTPIVEKSVAHSIASQRDKFVGYLYPLMGSLVRKYVSSFLNEILEKTNKVIENSFTLKGLKWRWQAKKSGVSFAEYVVSQTYLFRVEQVFLIHAETGLLLNAVSLNGEQDKDADLISAMLSAINDFINDSFNKKQSSNDGIDTIKTAHFTLVIKTGPLAIIAAAVKGNMPEEVPEKLQLTLEQIHQLYSEELQNYHGDNHTLSTSEPLLRRCLLIQEKASQSAQKPWYAIIIFILLFSLLFYSIIKPDPLISTLHKIDNEAGINVAAITKYNANNYQLSVWRDPAAITVKNWLISQKINPNNIQIKEQPFISPETKIIQRKIDNLLKKYHLTSTKSNNTLILQGKINYLTLPTLKVKLLNLLNNITLDTSQLTLTNIPQLNAVQSAAVKKTLLQEKLAQISTIHIDFARGSASLNKLAKQQIQVQSIRIKEALALAENIAIKVAIIIIGTSDNRGTALTNTIISKKRANTVKAALISSGVNAKKLYAIGIGEVKLADIATDTRKVIFSYMTL